MAIQLMASQIPKLAKLYTGNGIPEIVNGATGQGGRSTFNPRRPQRPELRGKPRNLKEVGTTTRRSPSVAGTRRWTIRKFPVILSPC